MTIYFYAQAEVIYIPYRDLFQYVHTDVEFALYTAEMCSEDICGFITHVLSRTAVLYDLQMHSLRLTVQNMVTLW